MEKERILLEKPTAQVRILAEEFLSDGQIHSRKQIVAYAQHQAKVLGLTPFRESHLAGGIREATANSNCEKLGRATFRAIFLGKNSQISCGEKAAGVCEKAMQQLTDICRDINYVNASSRELDFLMKVRECVQSLHNYQDEFKNCQEITVDGYGEA